MIQEAADESMQSDSDYGVKNKRKRVARKQSESEEQESEEDIVSEEIVSASDHSDPDADRIDITKKRRNRGSINKDASAYD